MAIDHRVINFNRRLTHLLLSKLPATLGYFTSTRKGRANGSMGSLGTGQLVCEHRLDINASTQSVNRMPTAKLLAMERRCGDG